MKKHAAVWVLILLCLLWGSFLVLLFGSEARAQTTTTLPYCTTTLPCIPPPTTTSTTTVTTLATTSTTRTTTTTTVTTTSTTRTTTTTTAPATPGVHVWSRRYGGTSDDVGNAVAVVPPGATTAGQIVMAGSFGGTASLGDAKGGAGTWVTAGLADAFVSRYDASRNYVCSVRGGGTADDVAYSVATDGAGTMYAGGRFQLTAGFGGTVLTSAGSYDGWLWKLDAGCLPLWAIRIGGTGGDAVRGVGTDAAGNVYVAGTISGTVDMGCGPVVATRGQDGFVARFSPDGACQWSHAIGGADTVTGLAVAPSGEHAVTGAYSLANFGGGQTISQGDLDAYLVHYDANGGYQWADFGGGTLADQFNGVAIDAQGNVVATGFVQGVSSIGGVLSGGGGHDIVTMEWKAAGVRQWQRRDGGPQVDDGMGVAIDAAGNVIVVGTYTGTSVFAGYTAAAHGFDDAFWMKLDPLGGGIIGRGLAILGGYDNERGRSVALTSDGSSILTGSLVSYVSFGGGYLISDGYGDAFLLKLTP